MAIWGKLVLATFQEKSLIVLDSVVKSLSWSRKMPPILAIAKIGAKPPNDNGSPLAGRAIRISSFSASQIR